MRKKSKPTVKYDIISKKGTVKKMSRPYAINAKANILKVIERIASNNTNL